MLSLQTTGLSKAYCSAVVENHLVELINIGLNTTVVCISNVLYELHTNLLSGLKKKINLSKWHNDSLNPFSHEVTVNAVSGFMSLL